MIQDKKQLYNYEKIPYLTLGIEFIIAIAIILFFISTIVNDFISIPMLIQYSLLYLVITTISGYLYKISDDKVLKTTFLGFTLYFIIQTFSGIITYIAPLFFDNPILVQIGTLLMMVGYIPILIYIHKALRYESINIKKSLKYAFLIFNIFFAIMILALTAMITLDDQHAFYYGSIYALTIVADLIVMSISIIFILNNLANQRKYIFSIILCDFFIVLIADILSMVSHIGLIDLMNYAQSIYSISFIFLAVAFAVYFISSSNNEKIKKVNQELFDTRKLMDDLVVYTPDAMCVADTDGRVVLANDKFLDLFKLKKVNYIGNYNIFKDISFITDDKRSKLLKVKDKETVTLNGIKFIPGGNSLPLYLSVKIFPALYSNGDISNYIVLLEDVTEREMTIEALQKSEALYKAVVQDQTEMICRFTSDYHVTFLNKACEKYFSYYNDRSIYDNFIKAFPEEKKDSVINFLSDIRNTHGGSFKELMFILPDGSVKWSQWTVRPVFDISGNLIEYQAVGRDVTEKKRAEEELQKSHEELESRVKARTSELAIINDALQKEIHEHMADELKLRTSLQEKEILLKEIHHRVKNNLQIVSSLFDLQVGKLKDRNNIEVFKESQNRIKSMALIHEKLYQSNDLAKIDFSQYISSLINYLYLSYTVDPGRVQLSLDVEDVMLDIETAIPCGLITNELISNALKYAFIDGRKGVIMVTLHSNGDGYTNLQISDNGVGLPEGMDIKNVSSLGLQLVNILVEQISGNMSVSRENGTTYNINFKN